MMNTKLYKIRKSDVFHLMYKLIVLTFFIFLVDQIIGNALRHYYFRQKSGFQYNTTFTLDKTSADLLIFGSSRANHHYDPQILEKRLNVTCYNAGRDGNFLLFHVALLKGVLARYSPKMVILDFTPGELRVNDANYDQLSSLLPYYKDHPEIRPIVNLKSKFEKMKLTSQIYPFNSSMLSIIAGNIEKVTDSSTVNGYTPLYGKWQGQAFVENDSTPDIFDSIKLQAYESLIKDCVNAHIKLYIVCSPFLVKASFTNCSIELGKEIASKYNVDFFDYTKNPTFISNPSYFTDILHLNNEGSKVFSNLLADDILKSSH